MRFAEMGRPAATSTRIACCIMFANKYQPGVISLFSSTGSAPLQLWSYHTDPSLHSDSAILLVDDTTSKLAPMERSHENVSILKPPSLDQLVTGEEDNERAEGDSGEGYTLCNTVLQIQSPTIPTTFIRCPPSPSTTHLGIKHPYMHMQVRPLGREFSFEVGILDQAGVIGVVRCSTFQVVNFS